MKINPDNYDYIMYVDASGDDGFKFEKDSSVCYAAAALFVKQEDIAHNLRILNEIKRTLGCKETDEIKYSRVRRHKKGDAALSLLRNIRGQMSCYVVFKKEIDQTKYAGNKDMSVICHYMAMRSVDSYTLGTDDKVLVAIDRMKKTEEEPLKSALDAKQQKNEGNGPEVSVIFRDSKDYQFLLIQIADLLCGAIREHFEQYETQPDMVYFSKTCPPCEQVRSVRLANARPLCKNGRSKAAHIMDSQAFKYVFSLFPITGSLDMVDYFFMEPVEMMDRHYYLICRRKK